MQCVCVRDEGWNMRLVQDWGVNGECCVDEASARTAGLPPNTHTQAPLQGSVYGLSLGIF